MASIGSNTFGGVSFGIVTGAMEGIEDFPRELQYAKRPVPYGGGTVNFQYSGVLELGQLGHSVVVSGDDWGSFLAKIGGVTYSLVRTGMATRNARLVKVSGARYHPEWPTPGWAAQATFEG